MGGRCLGSGWVWDGSFVTGSVWPLVLCVMPSSPVGEQDGRGGVLARQCSLGRKQKFVAIRSVRVMGNGTHIVCPSVCVSICVQSWRRS